MMIRNKSAPRLSSSASKNKIKQTIRVAMGKQKPKTTNMSERPKRSSSVQSLRSYNHMPNTQSKINLQSGQRRLSQEKLKIERNLQAQNIYRDLCSKAFDILNYKWWHEQDASLFIKKSEFEKRKENQLFFQFAFTYKFVQNVIVTVSSECIVFSAAGLTVYSINSKDKIMKTVNILNNTLHVSDLNCDKILIVSTKLNKDNLSQKAKNQQYNLYDFNELSNIEFPHVFGQGNLRYYLILNLITKQKKTPLIEQIKYHQQIESNKKKVKREYNIISKNINISSYFLQKHKK